MAALNSLAATWSARTIATAALKRPATARRSLPCAAAQRPARPRRCALLLRCAAASSDEDEPGPSGSGSGSGGDAERLNKLLAGPKEMSGEELRQLVMDKWGVSYDVRLQRRGSRMYLHVMWRFLEQQSFPLTPEEYELQLDAVASYLNLWQVQDTVRVGIKTANKRGPGYTGGGNARAISIPLGVDVGGAGRTAEWNSY